MTDLATAPVFRSPAQRTARGAGALRRAAALVVAAAAGAVALGAFPGASATAPRDRVALVADAGASPRAALTRARAWAARARRADDVAVAVRIPRSAAEAATDVRYFAAQGYGTVVVAGPAARAAAARARGDFAGTRFAERAGALGR